MRLLYTRVNHLRSNVIVDPSSSTNVYHFSQTSPINKSIGTSEIDISPNTSTAIKINVPRLPYVYVNYLQSEFWNTIRQTHSTLSTFILFYQMSPINKSTGTSKIRIFPNTWTIIKINLFKSDDVRSNAFDAGRFPREASNLLLNDARGRKRVLGVWSLGTTRSPAR